MITRRDAVLVMLLVVMQWNKVMDAGGVFFLVHEEQCFI